MGALMLPLLAAAALALPAAEQVPAPERALAQLARTALEEPAAVRSWAAIARALRALRPELHRDVPSAAERTAFEIVATLAERSPGAIRELRIEPVAPYTEIAIHGAGSAPYRIAQRGTSSAPSLVLTLRGAASALAESDYNAIGRGGVRALRLDDTGSDVELTVELERETDFALHRRGERLVLRIQNRAGAFAPWSTEQHGWGALRLAAQSESPAPEPASRPAVPEAAAAEAPAPAPAARVDTAEGAPGEVATVGKAPLGARARGMAGDTSDRVRDALAQPVTPGAAAVIAGILGLAIAAVALLRRAKKRSPLEDALDTQDPQSDPRLWVARTLAADGASIEEIAQRTGLTRDAVLLLLPPPPPPAPEETAASGTFFPPGQLPSTYTPRGGKWVKH